ncbi:uncharacterized protein LOC141678723 [Apium graveolens]|uniref:uncharacterized protein LOC141678723 n=1 Tax=Apium graveolens TaxID=4045 RepID=UPI003D7AF017
MSEVSGMDEDEVFRTVERRLQLLQDSNPRSLFDLPEGLMDFTYQTLVSMVKGKSVEDIRTKFIIKQDYDWNSFEKASKRARSSLCSIMRQREKEMLIRPSKFVYVQRSRLVTEALSSAYNKRWTFSVDFCIFKLVNYKNDDDLLTSTGALAAHAADQVLADRLKHDHVVLLFKILKEKISRQDIQSAVLGVLSRVNFTAHEKAMEADRIRLLVSVIFTNEEVFGTHAYRMTHLAVFTLTNIAKALPKFVVEILKTDVLERVQRVIVVHCTDAMVDNIAMFLVAVCRTDLSCLKKQVDLARIALQLLEANAYSGHYIEQACNALQYLTYGMELQIEELALKKLIEKLIEIIHKPPHGGCLFPGYALGVLGNIAIWGSSDQIEILTSNSKFLESLEIMMAGSKKIQKEVCQIISNIAARMDGLIEEMHKAGLIEALCRLLEKDEALEKDEIDVKIEAAWAICNGLYGYRFPPIALHSIPQSENCYGER